MRMIESVHLTNLETQMAKDEKEVRSVKMDDGSIVDFPGKARIKKSGLKRDDGSLALRIDFESGETRTFIMNPVLLNDFALHGMSQKYGDEVAGLKAEDGSAAPIEDFVQAMDELDSRVNQKGEWTSHAKAVRSQADRCWPRQSRKSPASRRTRCANSFRRSAPRKGIPPQGTGSVRNRAAPGSRTQRESGCQGVGIGRVDPVQVRGGDGIACNNPIVLTDPGAVSRGF